MKIPPLHYAVILLMEDFNLTTNQIAERLDICTQYVYIIKRRYKSNVKLTPEYDYKTNNPFTKKRLEKYTID